MDDVRDAISVPAVGANRTRRIAIAFKIAPVTQDIFICNYTDSSALNFCTSQRDRTDDQWKAALRRECRGLVVHRTGAVLVRPLHSFFCNWTDSAHADW
jgi:hypothetical protein